MHRTILFALGSLLILGHAAGRHGLDTLESTLRAAGSGAVWKYTESGVTRYYFEAGDLRYGHWYSIYPPAQGIEHGTAAFDLSPIPDTALIIAAEFGFCQYTEDTTSTPPYHLRVYDYSGQDPESLFNAVDTAPAASFNYEAHFGWNRVPLTEPGVTALRACLARNWTRVAIGERAWDELGDAYGCGAAESLRPYLLLRYLPTAVEEAGGRRLDAGLRISPNPAGGNVTFRFPFGGNDRAVLTLYEASGRLALCRPVLSSLFNLDVSALPSGVYVARIVSGDRIAGARLVVGHPYTD